MNILIAVPSYPGIIKSDCVVSLMGAQKAMLARGIDCEMAQNRPCDVVLARNIFGSFVLENERFTHVLFADNDMAFAPHVPLRLLDRERPLAGCVYPRKNPSPSFCVRIGKEQKSLTVTDGWCKVDALGMGLCLIERSVFVRMATSSLRRSQKHGSQFSLKGPLFGFFDPIEDENGELLPEDFSFCQRWRTLGGEIWALADEQIGHIGEFTYSGRYVDYLKR